MQNVKCKMQNVKCKKRKCKEKTRSSSSRTLVAGRSRTNAGQPFRGVWPRTERARAKTNGISTGRTTADSKLLGGKLNQADTPTMAGRSSQVSVRWAQEWVFSVGFKSVNKGHVTVRTRRGVEVYFGFMHPHACDRTCTMLQRDILLFRSKTVLYTSTDRSLHSTAIFLNPSQAKTRAHLRTLISAQSSTW